ERVRTAADPACKGQAATGRLSAGGRSNRRRGRVDRGKEAGGNFVARCVSVAANEQACGVRRRPGVRQPENHRGWYGGMLLQLPQLALERTLQVWFVFRLLDPLLERLGLAFDGLLQFMVASDLRIAGNVNANALIRVALVRFSGREEGEK